ncbi:MAG: hypothetical protein ABL884_00245 [Methyloglobulus sp.]
MQHPYSTIILTTILTYNIGRSDTIFTPVQLEERVTTLAPILNQQAAIKEYSITNTDLNLNSIYITIRAVKQPNKLSMSAQN